MDFKYILPVLLICVSLSACEITHLDSAQSFNRGLNNANANLSTKAKRLAEFKHVGERSIALLEQSTASSEGVDFVSGMSQKEIFWLSDAQRQEFDDFFFHPRYAHLPKHKRLSEFLTTRLANFSYDGMTYSASEAFSKLSGNCLSLAILTTALAQHAKLDIRYQRVDAPPVYAKHGNILLLSSHVVTRVYNDAPAPEANVIRSRGFVIIDYFPSGANVRGKFISDEDFLAMYYQNKSADALIKQEYAQAVLYLKSGFNLDTIQASLLNLAAVLLNNLDETAAAESLYQNMLESGFHTINAIDNYASLLSKQGNYEQANALRDMLPEAHNSDNPYSYLSLAARHFEQGKTRLAIKYAEKAADLAPQLHEPYHMLARIYASKRQFGATRKALEEAKALARTSEQEKRYMAKLNSLKGT